MTIHRTFKIDAPLFSWDEILDMFHLCHKEEGSITAAMAYNDKSTKNDRINNTFILNEIESIANGKYKERSQELAQALNIDKYKEKRLSQGFFIDYGIYMSFVPKAKSHGIHRDVADVFHWQQKGKTTFTIYEDREYVYVLNPGDCIYIPAGMYHNTLPQTPRAAISYAFFPGDYDGEWSEDYFTRKNIVTPYYNPFPKESKIFKL